MDDTLIDSLHNIHDASLHWEQDPVVIHNGIQVQLCHAIRKDATTPPSASNQLDFYPKNCNYQFDYQTYKGIDAAPALEQLAKSLCPRCTLYNQKRGHKTKGGFLVWSFYCNHYLIVYNMSTLQHVGCSVYFVLHSVQCVL